MHMIDCKDPTQNNWKKHTRKQRNKETRLNSVVRVN